MCKARFFAFCVAVRSYCARSARAERFLLFDATSWRAPRSGERRAPRGSPLDPRNAQTTLRYHFAHVCAKMSKFNACVCLWKSKGKHGSSTQQTKANFFAACYAPLFAKISNKDGIAKALANSKPICGVRYLPRRWRSFAKQKARRRLFSRRMPGGPQGERLGFLLGYFLGNAKK